MRPVALIPWLALAACAAPSTPPADSRWAALDREVPALLAADHVPSVSIARVEHGALVWAAAYGMQRPGVRATPATLYNLASMTKPFTAELVLRLAARGALTLDEPMAGAWVDPDLAADPRHLQLTPRLALSHRTGLPNWRRATGGKLAFVRAPGAVGYSGEGFEYVAHFVEHKTHRTLDELVAEQLFAPAGMTETAFTAQPWFNGRVAVPTAADGTPGEPLFAIRPNAADLAYATARDYARFLIHVMRHADLTASLIAEHDRIQVSTRAQDCPAAIARSCPIDSGFGLSWQVLQFAHATIVMHTGKDTGVSTFGYANLTDHSATVILTNSDSGMQLVVPILDRLAADPAFVAYLRASASK